MTAIITAGRGIVTPQGVVLDLEVAGVGHRGAARVVDIVVVMAALGAGVGLLELLPSTAALVGQLIFGFLTIFGYPVVAETFFRGRTIGKWAMGLRTVTLEAGPIGFREAFIRSLFQIVDIIASFGSIAIVSVMFSDRSQRLGDFAAGTFVIVDPRVVRHTPVVPFTPPMGAEQIVAEMDVSKLRPDQERLIRSFLLRIKELSGDARNEIGPRLAATVSEQLGHPYMFGLTAEPYLVAVLAARQMRTGGLAELAIE